MTTSYIDLGLDKIKYDKEKKFTLSIPPTYSESSSLASSPASTPIESRGEYPFHSARKHEHVSLADRVPPRKQPKDVYDTSLSWWRAAIRRKLVASVERESKVIAQMQVSIIISQKNILSLSSNTLPYKPHFPNQKMLINPNHLLGKDSHSMVRRLFRLYFLSRYTYLLHDRPSSHVFLWTS